MVRFRQPGKKLNGEPEQIAYLTLSQTSYFVSSIKEKYKLKCKDNIVIDTK